mmetsp:Transcript_94154/g.206227  ORF Transcript_94154/g.206227 Transcript_94154/m.206227 type:complete len:225 (+) Transcript_94154:1451-2125(+)
MLPHLTGPSQMHDCHCGAQNIQNASLFARWRRTSSAVCSFVISTTSSPLTPFGGREHSQCFASPGRTSFNSFMLHFMSTPRDIALGCTSSQVSFPPQRIVPGQLHCCHSAAQKYHFLGFAATGFFVVVSSDASGASATGSMACCLGTSKSSTVASSDTVSSLSCSTSLSFCVPELPATGKAAGTGSASVFSTDAPRFRRSSTVLSRNLMENWSQARPMRRRRVR